MRRVLAVVTARPSYSRIKSALVALRARSDVELLIVAAASALVTRFGRVVDEMRADGFDVAAEVSSVVEDDTLANSALSTGLLTIQLAGAFERLQPDVVVTVGDRHETLATATAASYQHIPLCHVQGGEVTGSIDDKVRNAVTQLADVHCVATDRAADNVMDQRDAINRARGVQNYVHVTGCPSIDLAAQLDRDAWHSRAKQGVIVLQHPVTDEADEAYAQMVTTIRGVAHQPLVSYFWPGEDAGGSAMCKALRMANARPVRNQPPLEFLRMLLGARVLVGNSSVGIRECSFLGVPVVNIGTRQRGRERGPNVIDVPHDVAAIREAVEWQVQHGPYESSTLYGDGHAGERIAAVLAGKAQEAAA
jgi:UDP-hydrolysing UDP-N-acetyl-D-glucosamine 2-epimerase